MNNTVISVEHLSKQYDLGIIGTGTLARDLERWWARVRKQPDPFSIIGEEDQFSQNGESILALDDINFTVEQGETLGIIGRNGAGKSTLLKILSRVTAPTSGVVKVKGRIGSLLEVGTGFHPELTGRENVFLNGAILGMRKEEVARKFDEIVDFSGVEKFIDTPVKRYSSGMYVRLAFAVAAHLDPEILIVDEVLAVGDALFQKKCLGKMGDVAKEGRTVLFVSHNMDAINTLCERTIWLRESKLFKNGVTNQIVSDYLNDEVVKNPSGLKDRTDRVGDKSVYFTKCEIVTHLDQNPRINFFTGDKIIINLSISANANYDIFIGLHIKDTFGKTITSFNSREAGFFVNVNKGDNLVLLEIINMPILEGTYSIDGVIVNSSTYKSCDRISNIASFSIFPNDFLDSGASFRAYHGVVFTPHRWYLNNKLLKSVDFHK